MIEGEACRTLLMFSIRALKALLFQDCYHVYSLYCNNISHLHLERAIFVDILLHIYSWNPGENEARWRHNASASERQINALSCIWTLTKYSIGFLGGYLYSMMNSTLNSLPEYELGWLRDQLLLRLKGFWQDFYLFIVSLIDRRNFFCINLWELLNETRTVLEYLCIYTYGTSIVS